MQSFSKLLSWLMVTVSIAALAVALTMQYGFGFKPCTFCLYARYPYVILLIVNRIWLLGQLPLRYQLSLNAFIVGGNFILSLAHVLLEKGLIHMKCEAIQYSGQESVQELMSKLTEHQSCVKVTVSFGGWSMALWHCLFAGIIMIVYIGGWIYVQQRQSNS